MKGDTTLAIYFIASVVFALVMTALIEYWWEKYGQDKAHSMKLKVKSNVEKLKLRFRLLYFMMKGTVVTFIHDLKIRKEMKERHELFKRYSSIKIK